MFKTEALPLVMPCNAYEMHPFDVIDDVFLSPYLT